MRVIFPSRDETTKLDIIVFQLQREQERIDASNTELETQFINASFYIEELEDGLREQNESFSWLVTRTLSIRLKN